MLDKKMLSQIKKAKPLFFEKAFPQIFSWKELEGLLNLRPFVSVSRFRFINNLQYTWNNKAWLTDVNTYPPALLEKQLKKYVCYFQDASRANPQINEICGKLDSVFSKQAGATDAHIYVDLSDSLDGGFGIHWDFSHNLIVQAEGSTRIQIWNIAANPESEQRKVDSLDEDPVIDVVMNVGDAVFVPRFYYHCAKSQTKRLSVSFPTSLDNINDAQDRDWIKLNKILKTGLQ